MADFTPKTIIKGDDLMLFDEMGKSIAYATSHTLTITGNTVDVTTKDHAQYSGTEVNKIEWELQSENLFTEEDYDTLFTKMTNRQKVKVYFGKKAQNDPEKTVANGDYANWTGANGYAGEVFITSLVTNANTGENSTFSVTMKGTGKLVKVNAIPTV